MTSVTFNAGAAHKVFRRAVKHLDENSILQAIGLRHLKWINDNFRAGGLDPKWKPLRPNTVAARRGQGAQPLRDSGRLAQSFSHQIRGSTVSIGTQMAIADYHHFGTKPYTIRPRAGRFLKFNTVQGVRFARIVHHPGLPKRPLLPRQKQSEEMAVAIVEAAAEKISD